MGKLDEAAFKTHPVHEAARVGRYKLVEKLLMSGHPADSLDNLNRSPLYIACSHLEREEIVKTLLENLPRPLTIHSIKDPLIMATAIGQLAYVEKLVRAGADVNRLYQLQIFLPENTSLTPVIYGLDEAKKFSVPGKVLRFENVSLTNIATALDKAAIAAYLASVANPSIEVEEQQSSPRSSLSFGSSQSASSYASSLSISSFASSPYSFFRNTLGRDGLISLTEKQQQLVEPLLGTRLKS